MMPVVWCVVVRCCGVMLWCVVVLRCGVMLCCGVMLWCDVVVCDIVLRCVLTLCCVVSTLYIIDVNIGRLAKNVLFVFCFIPNTRIV